MGTIIVTVLVTVTVKVTIKVTVTVTVSVTVIVTIVVTVIRTVTVYNGNGKGNGNENGNSNGNDNGNGKGNGNINSDGNGNGKENGNADIKTVRGNGNGTTIIMVYSDYSTRGQRAPRQSSSCAEDTNNNKKLAPCISASTSCSTTLALCKMFCLPDNDEICCVHACARAFMRAYTREMHAARATRLAPFGDKGAGARGGRMAAHLLLLAHHQTEYVSGTAERYRATVYYNADEGSVASVVMAAVKRQQAAPSTIGP